MWYPAKIKAGPDVEPVTPAEAKAQCGLPSIALDDTVVGLIAAARDHAERYCGIRIPAQTVELKCDCFGDLSRVPAVPVKEIVSISYVDTAGSVATVPPEIYELRADGLEAAIVLAHGQAWPGMRPGSRLTVEAVVGYEDGKVPPVIKMALLLQISHLYTLGTERMRLRSDEVEGIGTKQWFTPDLVGSTLTQAAERLLADFRVWQL